MVMQKNLNIFVSSQKDHMHAITKMNGNINMESTIAVPLVLFSFTFWETDRNVEISQLYIKRYWSLIRSDLLWQICVPVLVCTFLTFIIVTLLQDGKDLGPTNRFNNATCLHLFQARTWKLAEMWKFQKILYNLLLFHLVNLNHT